jgi:hypothetical protein
MVKGVVSVPVADPADAWVALQMAHLSLSVRGNLLDLVAKGRDTKRARHILEKDLCRGVPDEEKLTATFTEILLEKRSTNDLLTIFAQKPRGKMRAELLGVILAKASTSIEVLKCEAHLTESEKDRLVRRLLAVKDRNYRAHYAMKALCYWKGMSTELRSLMVARIAEDSHSQASFEILRSPSSYFPESAPMTKEERQIFFEALKSNRYTCTEIVSNFGRGGVYEQPLFLEEEVRELIPIVLEHVKESPLSSNSQITAKNLLEGRYGNKAANLLSAEQKAALQKIAYVKTA